MFRAGILGFIQNDESIVQRSAAHIGQRGNLNGLLFQQPLKSLRPKHIIQAIVQRPQVRVHLVLQITGQKAQLFARFHRRAGQNDPLHVLAFEGFHGHCHGQIGFARTGRPHAERNGMGLNGLEIFLLPQRFGAHWAALCRNGDEVLGQLLHPPIFTGTGQADAVAHRLLLDGGMVFKQRQHRVNGVCCAGHPLCLAGQLDLCAAANSSDGKFFFQQTNILITASEHRRCQLYTIKFNQLFCHSILPSFPASLYHSFLHLKL